MDAVIKTVLVVDDNRLPRMMEHSILGEHFPEMTVLDAGSGEEALEVARANQIDLALLDINMPGMDGMELAEHLKEGALATHICFVTANIQQFIRDKAEQLGAHFIPKPVSEEKLVALVNQIGGA